MIDTRPLLLVALSLAIPSAHAQSSDHAKILDIQTYSVAGTPSAIDVGGVPIVSSNTLNGFTITVRIDDILYSGQFRSSRKLHSSDFIVGDTLHVNIAQDKMFVTSPAGKEIKGKLVRRQRVPEKSGS